MVFFTIAHAAEFPSIFDAFLLVAYKRTQQIVKCIKFIKYKTRFGIDCFLYMFIFGTNISKLIAHLVSNDEDNIAAFFYACVLLFNMVWFINFGMLMEKNENFLGWYTKKIFEYGHVHVNRNYYFIIKYNLIRFIFSNKFLIKMGTQNSKMINFCTMIMMNNIIYIYNQFNFPQKKFFVGQNLNITQTMELLLLNNDTHSCLISVLQLIKPFACIGHSILRLAKMAVVKLQSGAVQLVVAKSNYIWIIFN